MKMLDLLPLLVVMPLVSGFESFGTVCHCKTLCTCDGLSEYMGCKKPCTGIFGDTTLLHSCSSFKVQCWDDLSIECTENGDDTTLGFSCQATAAATVHATIWTAWYAWCLYAFFFVLVIPLARKCLRFSAFFCAAFCENICSDASETGALNEAIETPILPPVGRAPTAAVTELTPDAPHDETVTKLAALKKLHDVGTISKEDFENKKAELLGRM